ncbi:DgyrCDS37 [Dimorphilus gyrociliatus]|uniref:DgyrCDS37 n=1 Tax=Dimorphilus gyrociliatus TaxID=2664684 RepID=A0A7I8V4Z2_9ANNE|nr:DgyrCDS37 [Dimorphilus gyrociliatus]
MLKTSVICLERKKVCEGDSVELSCPQSEIIVIEGADFGRKIVDQICVTVNFGHIGCGIDVTDYLHEKCSVTSLDSNCSMKGSLSEGWLSWNPNRRQRNRFCKVKLGRKGGTGMKLSVYRSRTDLDCEQSPRVFQSDSSVEPLCKRGDINKQVFVFKSSQIRLELQYSHASLILHYEVLGCGSPPIPRHATYEITSAGQMAKLKCDHGKEEEWELTCVGREWRGTAPINCSHPSSSDGKFINPNQPSVPPSLIAAVSIGLVIAFILPLGVLYVLKKRFKRRNRSNETMVHHYHYNNGEDKSCFLTLNPKKEYEEIILKDGSCTVVRIPAPSAEQAPDVCGEEAHYGFNRRPVCPYDHFKLDTKNNEENSYMRVKFTDVNSDQL